MNKHYGMGQSLLYAALYLITDGVGLGDCHIPGQREVEVDMAAAPGAAGAQVVEAIALRAELLDHLGRDG